VNNEELVEIPSHVDPQEGVVTTSDGVTTGCNTIESDQRFINNLLALAFRY